MYKIDLSGEWLYETDEQDKGIYEEFFKRSLKHTGFKLPGSSCDNKIGKKQEYYTEYSKAAVRAPRERYEYIAPLWLQRKINIPKEYAGKKARLFMERVNIASDLWIDGEKTERQIIELSAPHVYRIFKGLSEGEHTITLRIDNRDLLTLGDMASGYSVDTQGYWNGVIGKIELQFEDNCYLEDIQVYPDEKGIDIKLTEVSEHYAPCTTTPATLELTVTSPSGEKLDTIRLDRDLYCSHQVEFLRYDISNIEWWDEFNPKLYNLYVRYECNGICDEKDVTFGMRVIKTENKKIMLNGRQIALRGTIDCAQYPITGYPPTDIETYRRNFKIVKDYGLNHIRFHAWCPPESAFRAADELGIYISVEMPLWLNKDVVANEVGDDAIHRSYFTMEALTISKVYGNHPSFIMFSNGNENMGDFGILNDITTQIKAYDKRRIYTLTSNFDHPVLPCEDYLCAFDAGGNRIRIQDMYDKIAKNTYNDYSKAVSEVSVPIISFEVGQYCVYPDVDIIEKYTGNMMPVNFDIIKKQMINANVYEKRSKYIKGSGYLSKLLYKEDIESAMRTKDFGGFELLSLIDYTGQSTATVGMLDVFYDEKGITSPQEFKEFCNDVVPLFKADRIFANTDTINATLDLYDFGKEKIKKPEFKLSVYQNDSLVYETKTEDTSVSIPLDNVKKPAMLNIRLSVGDYTNSWNVFVYDGENTAQEFNTISDIEDIKQVIEKGGKAVIAGKNLKKYVDGNFVPVFWSPVHFPTNQGCGALIDSKHEVFSSFPTGDYIDYQWKDLMEHAKCALISDFGNEFKSLVELVPNYVTNTQSAPLFEARVGKAKLLLCGFDLDRDDAVSKQLKQSIYTYVTSGNFNPSQTIDTDKFMSLFEDNNN